MATILWPVLVAMLGFALYLLAGAKISELGRIAYFCGLFWTVYLLAGRAFHF